MFDKVVNFVCKRFCPLPDDWWYDWDEDYWYDD